MDRKKIEKAVRAILAEIDPSPDRPELKHTPARVARMFEEIFSGIHQDPRKHIKDLEAKDYDQMVILKDVPLYSVCEHHLLPFIGRAHIAYVPDGGRVTGLSKIARVVQTLARRLQVQERLTQEIAATLMETLRPKGVLVIIEAEHLCMSMRGVREPGAVTVTSSVLGLFRTNRATREEAIGLLK
ncbi:MAG: GTP cyclohydrolase I FolE, partial [bacterium]